MNPNDARHYDYVPVPDVYNQPNAPPSDLTLDGRIFARASRKLPGYAYFRVPADFATGVYLTPAQLWKLIVHLTEAHTATREAAQVIAVEFEDGSLLELPVLLGGRGRITSVKVTESILGGGA